MHSPVNQLTNWHFWLHIVQRPPLFTSDALCMPFVSRPHHRTGEQIPGHHDETINLNSRRRTIMFSCSAQLSFPGRDIDSCFSSSSYSFWRERTTNLTVMWWKVDKSPSRWHRPSHDEAGIGWGCGKKWFIVLRAWFRSPFSESTRRDTTEASADLWQTAEPGGSVAVVVECVGSRRHRWYGMPSLINRPSSIGGEAWWFRYRDGSNLTCCVRSSRRKSPEPDEWIWTRGWPGWRGIDADGVDFRIFFSN